MAAQLVAMLMAFACALASLMPNFEKTVKAMKDYPSVLRTGYAAALLSENDEKAASDILKKFEKTAVSYPYRSEIQAEKELMDIALKKKETKCLKKLIHILIL